MDLLIDLLQNLNIPSLSFGKTMDSVYESSISSVYGSSISGFIYFASDGSPEYIPLSKPPLFCRTYSSPLIRVYRLALSPIIARVNGVYTPLSKASGEVIVKTFLFLLLLGVISFPVWVVRTQITPYDKEVFASHARLANYPEIPRDLSDDAMIGKLSSEMVRLSDRDLYWWLGLREYLLLAASPQECTLLTKRTQSQGVGMENLLKRIRESDPDFVHSYFEFTEHLTVEAFKPNGTSADHITDEELERLKEEFINGMAPETQSRYKLLAENLSSHSDTEICWFERSTITRLRQMGETMGSKLARALYWPGQGK